MNIHSSCKGGHDLVEMEKTVKDMAQGDTMLNAKPL